jgi:hypothetical protein
MEHDRMPLDAAHAHTMAALTIGYISKTNTAAQLLAEHNTRCRYYMRDQELSRDTYEVAYARTQQLDDLTNLYRHLYVTDRNGTQTIQVESLLERLLDSSSSLKLPAWVSALIRYTPVMAAPITATRQLTKKRAPRKHPTITIRWSGPYSRTDIELTDLGYGPYLFAGKCYRQRVDRIQYCGITAQLFRHRFRDHHRLPKITRDLHIWLGTILSPKKPDRAILERAEKLLIYELQPELNNRCKVSVPEATTVVSHWETRDGKAIPNPLADVPDVLSWDGQTWRWGTLDLTSR